MNAELFADARTKPYDKIFRKKEPCSNYDKCNCLSSSCNNPDEDQR